MSTGARTPTGNTYALHNRVALVTGAAGALGGAIAEALAASGARVVGVTRTEPPQPSSGDRITYDVADVGNESSVEALVAKVVRDHGALDIVVNTVGGFAAGQPV